MFKIQLKVNRLKILNNKNNQRAFAIEDLLDSKYCFDDLPGNGVFGGVYSHLKERFMLKWRQEIFPKVKFTIGII